MKPPDDLKDWSKNDLVRECRRLRAILREHAEQPGDEPVRDGGSITGLPPLQRGTAGMSKTNGTAAAPATTVQARLIEVTPELAAKWLELNDHNRSMVMSRVDAYASDMRKGDWRLNGEAIKISRDGKILDGQHRLAAILEANVAIQTLVITGLEAEDQETMDQGRARSLADVFKLRGEKYHNPLATATRTLCLFELYGQVVQPAYQPAPTVPQASRTLARNPELRDSVAFAYGLRRPWLPSSHMGALHFLWATVDREAADDFLTKLSTGESLQRGHPIYALREQLISSHMDRETLTQRTQLALIIKAWNAYLVGDEVRRVQWTPGGPNAEPFPEISGLAKPDLEPTTRSRGGGLECLGCGTQLLERTPAMLCGFCAPEGDTDEAVGSHEAER